MPIRQHGYQAGVCLNLLAQPCQGCGRSRLYDLVDVHPAGPVFKCPSCSRTRRVEIREMTILAKRDCKRLRWQAPRFLIEGRLAEGYGGMGVPGSLSLRLLLPRCFVCDSAGVFWVRDVYDSGPLFACHTGCGAEFHLHLEEMVPYALENRRRLGGPIPLRLLRGQRLLEPADGRPEEALGIMREEAMRQGKWDGRRRPLPWGG